jgi:hypothetical protein
MSGRARRSPFRASTALAEACAVAFELGAGSSSTRARRDAKAGAGSAKMTTVIAASPALTPLIS